MVLGLPLETFTQIHVVFLSFTILTSVTGFLFPPKPIGPPFIFGVISLVVLALALYSRKVVGRWRTVYLLPRCCSRSGST